MIITIKQATQNIFSRLNWKVYKPTLFSIITLLSIFPCMLFLPKEYAWENSFIENLQLVIIAVCFGISLSVHKNKHFFRWISILCIILFLREINCGRIFFPAKNLDIMQMLNPDFSPVFKKWDEILPEPWCYMPSTLYGLVIVWSFIYLFVSGAFRGVWNILVRAKLDVINVLCLFIGVCFGIFAENFIHNDMLEETTETLFYVAFTVLVYLYGYNKDYTFTENKV